MFDIVSDNKSKVGIYENYSKTGFHKLLNIATPVLSIDLRFVTMVHQQAFETGYKVFGCVLWIALLM